MPIQGDWQHFGISLGSIFKLHADQTLSKVDLYLDVKHQPRSRSMFSSDSHVT